MTRSSVLPRLPTHLSKWAGDRIFLDGSRMPRGLAVRSKAQILVCPRQASGRGSPGQAVVGMAGDHDPVDIGRNSVSAKTHAPTNESDRRRPRSPAGGPFRRGRPKYRPRLGRLAKQRGALRSAKPPPREGIAWTITSLTRIRREADLRPGPSRLDRRRSKSYA